MTQFTTTISAMYTLDTPEPGFVVNVLWTVTGVDGQYTASIDGKEYSGRVYSTCSLPAPEGSFIAYNDLTQDTVLGWIWANGVDKAATEAAVNAQIQSAAHPTVVSPPLPW